MVLGGRVHAPEDDCAVEAARGEHTTTRRPRHARHLRSVEAPLVGVSLDVGVLSASAAVAVAHGEEPLAKICGTNIDLIKRLRDIVAVKTNRH